MIRTEDELISMIRKWSKSPKSPYGIGDDAALLKSGKGQSVISTDFLVEGIDFKKGEDLKRIGRKVLAINLSDLAAMGAKPTQALLTVAFPGSFTGRKWQQFFQGWNQLAKKYSVELIGGDVSSAKQLVVGAVIIGQVIGKVWQRQGAKTRDSLWVTGTLGGSIQGKHLDFTPRVDEALWLKKQVPVSACIDLSDGLGLDLSRLLKASHKCAHLKLDRIPLSRLTARKSKRQRLYAAFSDGEDFELLFTLNSRYDESLTRKWKKRFRTPLTKIGTIVPGAGIKTREQKKLKSLPRDLMQGFDHLKRG